MTIKIIDKSKMTAYEIEEHFFKKGYAYAMLHLELGLEEENLKGLEKVLMKHLDFLQTKRGKKK
jgi:hypothetical protein